VPEPGSPVLLLGGPADALDGMARLGSEQLKERCRGTLEFADDKRQRDQHRQDGSGPPQQAPRHQTTLREPGRGQTGPACAGPGRRTRPYHPVMTHRSPVTASQRLQRLPKSEKRVMRAAMIFLCLIGVLLAGVGLSVFLTQGSQIRVRANVLSERCHPQTDLATGARETRCDAQVQFTTVDGQVIRTTVTDAFPDEFSGTGPSRTIALRYDRGDPTQPYKQSNYMPVGAFVGLLIFGAATILYGGWMLYKLRPTDAPQRDHAEPVLQAGDQGLESP